VPVLITKVDATSGKTYVDFRAPTKGAAPQSRGPDELFTDVFWDKDNWDIWVDCPSSLPASLTTPPVVGDKGDLYLSESYIRNKSIYGTPKWPGSLPAVMPTKPVSVWPTKVVVYGYELEDGRLAYGSVNLLSSRHAATIQDGPLVPTGPAQQILLNGDAVTLQLTSMGFNEAFGLKFPSLASAVATIKEGADPYAIADAWMTIAAWSDLARDKPSEVTPEHRGLISKVLKQSTCDSANREVLEPHPELLAEPIRLILSGGQGD
jgi:hypothetical protein